MITRISLVFQETQNFDSALSRLKGSRLPFLGHHILPFFCTYRTCLTSFMSQKPKMLIAYMGTSDLYIWFNCKQCSVFNHFELNSNQCRYIVFLFLFFFLEKCLPGKGTWYNEKDKKQTDKGINCNHVWNTWEPLNDFNNFWLGKW